MIEWLIATIGTSATAQGVFAGVIATAPLAALMWLLKDFPVQLFNLVFRQFQQKLMFLSTMDNYQDMVHCIQDYVIWSRDKTIKDDKSLTIGYGTHYGKYKGVYFRLNKAIEQNNDSYAFKEKTNITFFSRKDKVVQEYLDESLSKVQEKLKIYTNSRHDWDTTGTLVHRPLSSVFYDKKDEIIKHIDNFIESEEKYMKRGMPYHTGILLYGIPGTGKTSLIKAIASHYNRHINALNPAVLSDGNLGDLMYGDWKKRILVIEDIDVSGVTVDRENKKSLTLSELLNTLDGLSTPHGLITIATTNNIEKLDTALTRPGRFDLLLEVGKLTEQEAQQMAEAFETTLEDYTPMTGAELRQKFLKNNS